MEDTGTSLDSLFEDQTAPEPVESADPAPQPDQPDDKGAPATPPVAQQTEPDHVPRKAMLEERRKRQEYERRAQEFEQKNAEAERQLAEARQYFQQIQAQQATQQKQGLQPEQFSNYEDFMMALARSATREELQQFAQTQAEQQKQQAIEFRQRQHVEALARQTLEDITPMLKAGAEKYADFADVIGNPHVNISEHARDYAAGLDNGHDVVYHLAQNPAEADRIFRLPNSSQSRELAKIAKAVAAPPPAPVIPSLPKTLTQTRSAGGQFNSKWAGPTPLDEVVRRPK